MHMIIWLISTLYIVQRLGQLGLLGGLHLGLDALQMAGNLNLNTILCQKFQKFWILEFPMWILSIENSI